MPGLFWGVPCEFPSCPRLLGGRRVISPYQAGCGVQGVTPVQTQPRNRDIAPNETGSPDNIAAAEQCIAPNGVVSPDETFSPDEAGSLQRQSSGVGKRTKRGRRRHCAARGRIVI